eukprot:jgi/Undpi1/2329/HiC_scaffold_13.g05712.m1
MDEQCDTMDGLEEGAPGVLALLERAGKKGLDWLAQAMEGIDAAAQMVMEMLRRAAETGEEFVDIAVEMLASYWGFRNRPGQESESGVCETELVQMVAKNSPCPTE